MNTTNELDIERLREFIVNTEHEYGTTHQKLCFAIIARIYRRVKEGYRFGAITISDGELIIDGNHRYIAYKLANIELETKPGTRSFIDVLKKFNEIDLDILEDWDANHPNTQKYCNDDFLNSEHHLKSRI